MKDSQRLFFQGLKTDKYIKVNNERFSTKLARFPIVV